MDLRNQFDHTDEFLEDIECHITQTAENVENSCVDGRMELSDDGMDNILYVKECLEQALRLVKTTRRMNRLKEKQR